MLLPAVAIFQSDRGSNYTSQEFAETLDTLGILQSVGCTGICFDNAIAESFFRVLKVGRMHRSQYLIREHARRELAHYIEIEYNTGRMDTGPEYCIPWEVYDASCDRRAATC